MMREFSYKFEEMC